MLHLANVARQLLIALVTIAAFSASPFALVLVAIVGVLALLIMSRFGM